MTQRKRKKDLVDPAVQGYLARRLAIHWLLFTSVTICLVLVLEWQSDPFQSIGALVSTSLDTYGPILLAMLGLLPIFIFDSIRLSKRFAGPVYRLRQVARMLASGETPQEEIRFRENDFWKDLAVDFNLIVARLVEADKAKSEIPKKGLESSKSGGEHLEDLITASHRNGIR